MKKIIAAIAAAAVAIPCVVSLSGCSGITADGSCNIKAMVLGEGQEADRTLDRLSDGVIANIDITKDINEADIIYVTGNGDQDMTAIEQFVYNGGTAVIDNTLISGFSKQFLGAAELKKLDGCPYDMTFEETGEDLRSISELLYDYSDIFKNYENVRDYEKYDYGMGIVPSTAEVIAGYKGVGVYTHNRYGSGNVFVTSPFLPGRYTVTDFKEGEQGEPFAASTVTAGTLLDGYYAEYVSKEKYGFAVERTLGSFAVTPAAWELHYEDITGVENRSLETFTKLCVNYGQMPSYTLARNIYTWFKRAESVTYLTYEGVSDEKPDGFGHESYEGVYCTGKHIASAGRWIELDHYENTESYFDDLAEYTKRAYPFVTDWNDDGKADLICGSADGRFYYYEGNGMGENYETGVCTMFTDASGEPLSVGAYSSPVIFDVDGDGRGELVSGAEDGKVRVFRSLKSDENRSSMAFEYAGDLIDTGLCDSMIDAGDLNGDGITDLAVGSRNGELYIYYGQAAQNGAITFGDHISVDTGESRIAPCIHNGELYGGTLEGYIKKFGNAKTGYGQLGYMRCDEVSRRGNDRITIGMNSVPRFYDIDGDGDDDLICGSLEYGIAYPIDSDYFPYKDELQRQIDFCEYNNIYMGVHGFTNRYASPEHEEQELEYHKKAFRAYDLKWDGKGANQHTWFTSQYGYDRSGEDGYNPDYNGTFDSQSESGLLWNSGFTPPESGQVPQSCAENTLPMPVYDKDRDFLRMQVCNTPHGNGAYSYLSVKYRMPMLFYNHCDYIYEDEQEQEKAITKVAELTDKYDYLFVGEDQMAKAVAAAYNMDIKAEVDGEDIIISGKIRDKSRGLYDKTYADCAGVKVVFASKADAEAYSADSAVSRKTEDGLYTVVGDGVVIGKGIGSSRISHINIPADVSDDGETVKFCEGGLMCVRVTGRAVTPSDGWVISENNGYTTFMKFGPADKLKIEYK